MASLTAMSPCVAVFFCAFVSAISAQENTRPDCNWARLKNGTYIKLGNMFDPECIETSRGSGIYQQSECVFDQHDNVIDIVKSIYSGSQCNDPSSIISSSCIPDVCSW